MKQKPCLLRKWLGRCKMLLHCSDSLGSLPIALRGPEPGEFVNLWARVRRPFKPSRPA